MVASQIEEDLTMATSTVDWPRAVGSPRAWHAALIFLRTRLGRSAGAFAGEFRARRAINHLRSLDGNRLWDLGIERKDIDHVVRFARDREWNG
jgi:uncharacterized protein YjiS (DUF1127 family)